MPDFFFTFGQAHFTVDGEKMSDSWVRVTAADEMAARSYFAQFFATPVMGKPDKWAFSYREESFNEIRHYFPAGECEHLTAYQAIEEPVAPYIDERQYLREAKEYDETGYSEPDAE